MGFEGLQLLDSEQLEFAFQAHGITLECEARLFYTNIWAVIQTGEKVREAHEMTELSSAMRHLCDSYFRGVRKWREEEEEHLEGHDICHLSQENMRSARILLPAFEKQFFRYALCYLELNRLLIQKRVQLSHFAKDYNIDNPSNLMDVNHATGDLLERVHKDRHVLLEKRARLEHVKSLLEKFDAPFEWLGEWLPKHYGAHEGNHQLTIFKGALRHLHFADAGRILRAWEKPELRERGEAILALAQTHSDELKAQATLMLHSSELSLVLEFLTSDEERLDGFLEKFNVPYMVFQYRNLIRQGYLLGRIGSIESLIIQHAKLSALAARPHNDQPLARKEEGMILSPARVMLDREFLTLSAIFTEVETTCAILEKLFAQTRDYTRA